MLQDLAHDDPSITNVLSEYVATSLADGRDRGGIIKELVKQGWPKDGATQFVDGIQQQLRESEEEYRRTPEGRQALARQSRRRMLSGFLWAAGGTAVTAVTYSAASEGGYYVAAWGAIIFGIIDFLRGLVGWLKYRP